jgi:hypothetical protein
VSWAGICADGLVTLRFQEVNNLASSLYAPGTNLSRSVSSVGEHQSEAYISPTLPNRAETFGGFDNANKDQLAAAAAAGMKGMWFISLWPQKYIL